MIKHLCMFVLAIAIASCTAARTACAVIDTAHDACVLVTYYDDAGVPITVAIPAEDMALFGVLERDMLRARAQRDGGVDDAR